MVINTHRRQRGLSLVEVFVALLILSVGLIALAKLQVDLVRGGSDSRARAAALAIAEAKLEDLRTFSLKQAPTGVAWPVADDEPVAWSMITDPLNKGDTSATDAGGRNTPGLAPDVITQAGVQYDLSWTATRQSTDGPVAGGGNQSFFADVAVNVSWSGPDDVPQTVTLAASIPDTPPTLTALASMPIVGGEGPQLLHTPGEAPEVIAVPIDVGGTTRRETSKPLPTVTKSADSTMVTFDVVNYSASTYAVQRREEFVTISCRCKFAAAGTGPARTPAKVVLSGNLLRDQPGKIVTKTIGVPSGQQPDLCNICCRDHHDNGVDYRYNPEANGDHAHVVNNSGDYDEACRLKRINGIFQVFEDWNLRTLTVLPKTDLEQDADKADEYVQAVQDFVKDFAAAKAGTGTPPAALNFEPSPVSVNPNTPQLLARAIYIDNMPQPVLDKIDAILNDADTSNDDSVLSLVPFYEVHLTKLADWSVYPDLNRALVTSDDIETDTEGLADPNPNPYSRGVVQPAATPTAGDSLIVASAKSHNTGVTGTQAVNPTEESPHPRTSVSVGHGKNATTYHYTATNPASETSPATLQHKDGTLSVAVAGNTSTITISGSMKKAKGSGDIEASNINVSISGVPCTLEGANGQDVEAFACVVVPGQDGWTGTIQFSSTANYVFCPENDGADATKGKNAQPARQCTALPNNGDWIPTTPLTANTPLTIYVSTPVP